MNCHLAQSLAATAEMTTLMPPSANIILHRSSSSIIAQIQDPMLMAFRMSLPGQLYTWDEAMELLFASVNGHLPESETDPHGDARSTWHLPIPAVSIRCPGNGKHVVGRAAECTHQCHDQHIDMAETCTTPCRRHVRNCEARLMETCSSSHMINYWTGIQLISLLLPADLNASRDSVFRPRQFGFVRDGEPPLDAAEKAALRHAELPWCVVDGEILYGTMNKSAIGQSHRSIAHYIIMATGHQSRDDATGQYPDRNRMAARRFISGLCRMAVHCMSNTGFSVGIGDMLLGDERAKAQIALAVYGAEPPAVPDVPADATREQCVAIERERRRIDPVRFGVPRPDLAKHDAKAVPMQTLQRLKIPFDPKRHVGVERAVAKIDQDHYKSERRAAAGDRNDERAFTPQQRVERLEAKKRAACEAAREAAREIVQSTLTLSNNVAMMICAGTKGSWINTSNMIACIGPQTSNGRRVCDMPIMSFAKKDFDGTPSNTSRSTQPLVRWYPHTPTGTPIGAWAGGMVYTGYIDGCDPISFFNLFYGCRDGLVDTATKTGETGYIQRRMVKIKEGIRAAADGTLRNEGDRVICFAGAGSRVDPRFLMSATCEPLSMPTKEFERSALIVPGSVADWEILDLCATDRALAVECATRERRRLSAALGVLRTLPDYIGCGASLRVAGDIGTTIVDSMRQNRCAGLLERAREGYRVTSSIDIDDAWRARIEQMTRDNGMTPLTVERAVVIMEDWLHDGEVAKHDFVTLTHVSLQMTAKQLILRYQMPEEILTDVLYRHRKFLIFARTQTGDAIGLLCAQALGEPLTQLTLQTFYVAGREAPVTRGVPRMTELASMRATESMRTPVVEVRFDESRSHNEIARSERLDRAPLSLRAPLNELYGQAKIDEAFADAMSYCMREQPETVDESRVVLELVTRSIEQSIETQYHWNLDTMFCDWATAANATDISATLGVALYRSSTMTAYGLCARANSMPCLVARVSTAYAATIEADLTSATDADRVAYIELLASNVTAAVVPLTGTQTRCVCVPLFADDKRQWVGIAFVGFASVKQRVGDMFESIRLKRSTVPVLNPMLASARRASCGDMPTLVAALEVEFMAEADAALDARNADKNQATEYSTWFGDAVLAPLRRELPRIVLDEIIDLASITFAPLVVRADGRIDIDGDLSDRNDHDALSTDLYHRILTPPKVCPHATSGGTPKKYAFCRPDIACLGSFLLTLRLNFNWFSLTMYDAEVLCKTVASYIGDCFEVFIGDTNSCDYVPLKIRVRTCRLDEAASLEYDTSRLVGGEAIGPRKPVAVLDPSMVGEHVDDEMHRWQTQDDRNDRVQRPFSDVSYLRELRLARGFVPPVDTFHAASPLVHALCAEMRRLLRSATADLGVPRATPRVDKLPPEIRALLKMPTLRPPAAADCKIHQHQIALYRSDLARRREWLRLTEAYLLANLPTPDRKSVRVYPPPPPLPYAVKRKYVAQSTWTTLVSMSAVVAHVHTCLAFIDAHTPVWVPLNSVRTHRPPVRPPPPPALDAAFVDLVRAYFRDAKQPDPLGRRSTQTGTASITAEDVEAERQQLQTQVEHDALSRLLDVLRSFYFIGAPTVGAVQTRDVRQAVFVPETGLALNASTTIADVATTDFSVVANFRGIDQRRVKTNAVLEVERVLGVEAARKTLITQYADVFAITGQITASNHANIALLAAIQTSRGCLPISWQGATYLIDDKLQSMSFERAPMVAAHAAVARTATTDIKSPSTAMMFALNTPGFGTSAFDVLADHNAAQTGLALRAPPMEERIAVVYPVQQPPDVVANSPMRSPTSSAYSPTRSPYTSSPSPPPTSVLRHVEMNGADELGIEPTGSFSASGSFSPPRPSTPEPESDDDDDNNKQASSSYPDADRELMPPPPAPPRQSLIERARQIAARRRAMAPTYTGTDEGYDPSMPVMTLIAPTAPSVPEYDPTMPAMPTTLTPAAVRFKKRMDLSKVHF